jgi:trehalose 6-phosphate phosphatase
VCSETKIYFDNFMEQLNTAPSTALLLDYDGTLAPFQADPKKAYPYEGVLQLLEQIVAHGRTRVVIVTGRPVDELGSMVKFLRSLEIWGSHGLERHLPDGTYHCSKLCDSTQRLLQQAEELVASVEPGARVEMKPGGIAIHWRGLPVNQTSEIAKKIAKGWQPLTQSGELKLLEFDGGLELRATRPDKSDAVTTILMESEPNASVAYLGDDTTDEDAFRALGNRGLSVLVRPEYRQTAAKVWIKPPDELKAFLEQWIERTKSQ